MVETRGKRPIVIQSSSSDDEFHDHDFVDLVSDGDYDDDDDDGLSADDVDGNSDDSNDDVSLSNKVSSLLQGSSKSLLYLLFALLTPSEHYFTVFY